MGMIRVHQSLAGVDARMLLQVHDELLFECPPLEVERVAAIAREGMGEAYEMRVPLKVDVKAGPNWAEMSDCGFRIADCGLKTGGSAPVEGDEGADSRRPPAGEGGQQAFEF